MRYRGFSKPWYQKLNPSPPWTTDIELVVSPVICKYRQSAAKDIREVSNIFIPTLKPSQIAELRDPHKIF